MNTIAATLSPKRATDRTTTEPGTPSDLASRLQDPLMERLFGVAQCEWHAPQAGNTIVAGIVIEADAGLIVMWNSGAEQVFGHSPAGVIGTPLDRLIPHEVRAEFRAEMKAHDTRNHGRFLDACVPFAFPAQHRTGEVIDVDWTLSWLEPSRIGRPSGHFVLVIVRPAPAFAWPDGRDHSLWGPVSI
jgi:PAS domain S-box-containing protein